MNLKALNIGHGKHKFYTDIKFGACIAQYY